QLKKKKSQSEEKSSEPHGIVELSKGNEPTTFTISMNTSTKFKFIFPGYAEDFFVNCKLEDEQGVVNITHSFNVAYKINKQDHQKSLDFTKKYKDPSTTTNDKGSVMDEYEIGTNISGNFFRDKNMPDPKTPYKLFLQAEFGQNGIITRIVNADNDDEKNVTTKNTLFPMHNQAKEVAEDILFCMNILNTKILSNLRRMDRTGAEYNTLNQAKKMLVDTIDCWCKDLKNAIEQNKSGYQVKNQDSLREIVNEPNNLYLSELFREQSIRTVNS
ncbi:hypothetical protein RFI_38004, partial [Reticulomyxa filosa]